MTPRRASSPATTCVALLRGVNVGRAKRVAMADLRRLMEDLGFSAVRTVLNSGNVVFDASAADAAAIAARVEAGIEGRFGFSAAVVVVTAGELREVVAENTLAPRASDPSRLLVAFAATPAALAPAAALLSEPWAPEAFALGRRAAYLWCPQGVIASRVMQRFAKATGDAATARNWATVLKLMAAVEGGGAAG